jgi:glutamate racemase
MRGKMGKMTRIGVFDSGVGGLSVLREIRALLPSAELLYFADSGHIPYGPRPLEEVRGFAEGITRFLLDQGAGVIVVACNTASAAALKSLRITFPGVPFVGMEPAVKPAAEQTRTGVVGVLATPATFQGELFGSVVERFAQGVRVIQQICPGLVQQIEVGELDTPNTEAMLRGWVEPLLAQNIDALVLGCTHYPFVAPLLAKICGPGVRLIDPAPAVARQTVRMTADNGRSTGERGRLSYFTSGDVAAFQRALTRLGAEAGEVRGVGWEDRTVRPDYVASR